MKSKPEIGQKVVVFIRGDLYDGKVIEVFESSSGMGVYHEGIPFAFMVLVENMYFPPRNGFLESRRDHLIRSSSFHLEPGPDDNIEWTGNGKFAQAFIFLSGKNFEKWKVDVLEWNRDFHLRKAKFYSDQIEKL